jgi:phenylglyoxylate dehydrogenase epsilon subunit
MPEKQFIIVGDGPAGLNAAQVLRSKDSQSKITLIGQEPTLPYSPTILPYFVSGKIKEKDLSLSEGEYFKKENIELILGKGVVSLSPQEGKLILKDDSTLHYDALILSQGGSPIIPNIPGLREVNPLVLRTLTDAKRLRSKALKASKAIILGAGLIGMQTAQALSEMSISVEVIELLSQVLPGYFDQKAATLIQKAYESHRVNFYTSTQVERVEFKKGNYIPSLKKGKTLNAPLLFVAAGVAPNIGFLKGSGIEVDKGILVDKAMRTNIPNIFAAGDVVQMDDFWGGGKVNQPILIHAVDQGRMAAASVLGDEVSHTGNISMNLFHFFGQNAFSIGLVSPDGEDRFQIYQTYVPSKRRYFKFVFDGDLLVGVMAINAILDPGILLQLIRRRFPLSKDKGEFLEKPLEMGRKLMCQNWR